MYKFYYARGTCALASHIALEEAGAPYTAERLDFKNNQQNSPEHLAINPKGRVPTLVTDRGILTETPAILAFIAQSFPQAMLAPFEDAFTLAEVQAFRLTPAPMATSQLDGLFGSICGKPPSPAES